MRPADVRRGHAASSVRPELETLPPYDHVVLGGCRRWTGVLLGSLVLVTFSAGTAGAKARAQPHPNIPALEEWKRSVSDASRQSSLQLVAKQTGSKIGINYTRSYAALPNTGYEIYSGELDGHHGSSTAELGPNGVVYISGDPWGLYLNFLVSATLGNPIGQVYAVQPGELGYQYVMGNGLSIHQIAQELLSTGVNQGQLGASYDGTWTKQGKKVYVLYIHNLGVSSEWSTAYVTTGPHPLPLELDADAGVFTYKWGAHVHLPEMPLHSDPGTALHFGLSR